MKRFAEYFKEETENVNLNGISRVSPLDPSIDDGKVAVYDVKDPKKLQQLNAFVGFVGEREHFDPEVPINELQKRLLAIGIAFDFFGFPANKPYPEYVEIPLKKFGGVYGQNLETGDIGWEDGFGPEKFSLAIDIEPGTNGKFSVVAEVVPA